MKIGILTYHRSYNYGAFMQCYSLVRKLMSDFPQHNIEVIDYTTLSTYKNYIEWTEKQSFELKNKIRERNELFGFFQSEYLPLSSEKIISDNENDLYRIIDGKYDIIIVGSDAVWNWNGKPFPNAYFLNHNLNAIKLSYAASCHGLKYKALNKDSLDKVNKAISDFKYIGVREKNVEKFLKKAKVSEKIYNNCDPTVFLNVKELPVDMDNLKKKLIGLGFDFNKKIIGVMADSNYITDIKKHLNSDVQIVAIYTPNENADVYITDLNPFEWANIFSFFDITITHFFHGTLFSLLNNVPVISIDVKNGYSIRYETKIYNVLKNLDLLDFRFIWDSPISLVSKLLAKYRIVNYDKKNIERLSSRIEEILQKDNDYNIKEKLIIESDKYNSLKDFIKNSLQNSVEGELND